MTTMYVAVCCSVLQCVAVCCSVLQCVAVCCSHSSALLWLLCMLQCLAVCCKKENSFIWNWRDLFQNALDMRSLMWLPNFKMTRLELFPWYFNLKYQAYRLRVGPNRISSQLPVSDWSFWEPRNPFWSEPDWLARRMLLRLISRFA